jgi:uncharacterized Fe-S center protein
MDDYFRKNGEYLYTDNSSTDNIRVINSEESYSMIMNSSADNDSKAKMLKANSEEINAEKISSEAGIKILDHYYEAAGFSSEELKTGGLIKNQERGLLAQFTPSKSKTGELHLEANPDILGFKVKSTSDAINLFKHEHKHIEDFKTGRPSPTNHPEYNALRTQLLDKTWDKTTPSFKQTMYNAYGHYLLQKSDQKKYFNNYGIHKITN